jgi:hypothetical protein
MRRRGGSNIGSFSGKYRLLLRGGGGLFGNQRGRNLSRLRSSGGFEMYRCRRLSFGFFGGRNGFRNWFGRRLDHHGYRGRRHGDGRTLHGASRRLGNHRFGRRTRGNGGRRGDDGRRGAGLRNNLARFRPGWRSGRLDGNRNRRRWTRGRRLRRCFGSLKRQAALPGFGFLFLLLGLDGFQHVAGLGDMREINLRRNGLRGARSRRAYRARGTRSTRKMRANLLGLIFLQ